MTHAYWLTASCIWNSFLKSGKRHIIITGSKKIGKSTLLKALFPSALPGITTTSVPRQKVYLKDNLSSRETVIGIHDCTLPGDRNKMKPIADGFNSLGKEILHDCIHSDSQWVSIDEIGYLETDCTDYCGCILQLMEHKRLAAVVRKQSLPFLIGLCSRDDVFLIDLDNPFGNTGCVIMASGLGNRFGSNKLMADFLGQPLIARALDATDRIFAKRVVVTRHEDVAALCCSREVEVILHSFPYRSDTVRLGLEAVGRVDGCMFCPADQPLLRRDTVASLALAFENNREFIWRTSFNDTCASPVIFPKWAFPELLSLPDGKGGGHIIRNHPEKVRTVSAQDIYELRDVDTPEDLQELLSAANSQKSD